MVDVTTRYAWDGEYIYGYVTIVDPTLLSRGYDYCCGERDPWQNDMLEVWYKLGEPPTSITVQRFAIDFYGHRLSAYDSFEGIYNSISKFFDKIEYKVEVVEEAKTSYIFFKIYAKTEEGKVLQAGDAFYSTYQVDDLRDLNNHSDMYSATSNACDYINGYVKYILGEKNKSDK